MNYIDLIEYNKNFLTMDKFKELTNIYEWLKNSSVKIGYCSNFFNPNIVSTEGYKEFKKYPPVDKCWIYGLTKLLDNSSIYVYEYMEFIEKYDLYKRYIHSLTIKNYEDKRNVTIKNNLEELKKLKENYSNYQILNIQWYAYINQNE